jgi:hypothetical protein
MAAMGGAQGMAVVAGAVGAPPFNPQFVVQPNGMMGGQMMGGQMMGGQMMGGQMMGGQMMGHMGVQMVGVPLQFMPQQMAMMGAPAGLAVMKGGVPLAPPVDRVEVFHVGEEIAAVWGCGSNRSKVALSRREGVWKSREQEVEVDIINDGNTTGAHQNVMTKRRLFHSKSS